MRRNPDIILGSWCGKKFRPENVVAREGWSVVNAVRHQQLFEIKSPEILQPGPAALTDGVAKMHQIILKWMDANMAPTLPTPCGSLPPEGDLRALGRPGGADLTETFQP